MATIILDSSVNVGYNVNVLDDDGNYVYDDNNNEIVWSCVAIDTSPGSNRPIYEYGSWDGSSFTFTNIEIEYDTSNGIIIAQSHVEGYSVVTFRLNRSNVSAQTFDSNSHDSSGFYEIEYNNIPGNYQSNNPFNLGIKLENNNDFEFDSYNSFFNNNYSLCFYGFVNIMTNQGLKLIQDLKRGDLILTNDGYQPLSKLIKSRNTNKIRELMVKIPKDYFCENIPSEDIYTTHTHPLSVKILSDKDDGDFEYLHFFVKELMNLNDGVELCYLEKEDYIYNLAFDKHYELNIGGLKLLSHHPNHNNGNYRLHESDEFNHENRSKKVYADKKSSYFKRISLKNLLKDKPSEMTDKEYLASVLRFD